jgi:hypothetical protein
MDRRSYPMLSIPVLVTADQYWRRPPAPPPLLTAELTPLVAAESLTPLAEAESLAQLVAGDPLAQLVAGDPLAQLSPTEPVLVEPAVLGAPVEAVPGRRRRLRLPIRRVPR